MCWRQFAGLAPARSGYVSHYVLHGFGYDNIDYGFAPKLHYWIAIWTHPLPKRGLDGSGEIGLKCRDVQSNVLCVSLV